MVRLGHADGSVAGAVYTTADVVRTAIQIIGVRPVVQTGVELLSDDAVRAVPHAQRRPDFFRLRDWWWNPDADELAEIAMAAADSAQSLLMDEPRVAMLSFSTSGSAHHAAVDKVVEATRG